MGHHSKQCDKVSIRISTETGRPADTRIIMNGLDITACVESYEVSGHANDTIGKVKMTLIPTKVRIDGTYEFIKKIKRIDNDG